MALPDSVKKLVAASARALLARGIYTIQQIVQKVAQKFGLTSPADRASISSIARQQNDAYYAAQNVQGQPSQQLPGRDLPIDWSLVDHSGRYGYTVRATFANPQTGEKEDTLIVVTSDTVQSGQSILDAAQQQAESLLQTAVTSNPNILAITHPVISLDIISAGRHP